MWFRKIKIKDCRICCTAVRTQDLTSAGASAFPSSPLGVMIDVNDVKSNTFNTV